MPGNTLDLPLRGAIIWYEQLAAIEPMKDQFLAGRFSSLFLPIVARSARDCMLFITLMSSCRSGGAPHERQGDGEVGPMRHDVVQWGRDASWVDGRRTGKMDEIDEHRLGEISVSV